MPGNFRLADGTRIADSSERKTVGVSAFKPNRQQARHKRKVSRSAS